MDLDAVTDRIKDGKPVGVLVHITDTFLDPKSDIVADSTLVPTSGSHAVVAAGYGTHKVSKEPHVLVRNSWGPNWGKQGMAWLPRAYLMKHGIAYFEVQ
jgi:C1A family cysteine protease